ncbi:2-dehydropantoate 2-reductase N-terminal domain-containing protein [Mastigocoleus sp. MO_188.B34]|uniref:ketopantoate reductase family protein n=1 Tax=Mastigocoleus sp. MO_188.B34 TaxID=3036635 RepID=UPI002628CB5C|nr:2-dehydropantoate 2-reductase N-terminal domain-containing protein [Mastigocoleus sp. MO_188.B34]MDJ0693541.1 2-dehydropantoate 2-reductase N-terminal domain-containing protein [Mastigocoleus sp. MO_188.B34]
MKILFYGAGVIGSLYAARLQDAGNDVSILARRQRLKDIREYGIVLEHALTGKQTTTHIDILEQLSPEDAYDLIVVVTRKNQVQAVLPILSANKRTPNVMFMVNNPSGYDDWIQAVGRERLLLGFPGAGGTLEKHIVRYIVVSGMFQPTKLGELDGRITPRLKEIVSTFKQAGFPVAISRNMDAWQKTHVALVSPIANALYMAGGDNYRLAQMPEALHLMVRAIREGFQVLRALGIPITPAKLRLWEWLPEPILVALLRRWVNTKHFEAVAARHANAARDEMKQLADDFKVLARQMSVATPAINQLTSYIDLHRTDSFGVAHT